MTPRPPAILARNALRLSAALALAFSVAAWAPPCRAGPVDKVWVGGFAHSVGRSHGWESGTQDYVVELNTARQRALHGVGSPRLGFAVSLNSAGHSNMASAGLVWDRRLWGRVYGSFDFGLGVTDGLVRPRSAAEAADRRHARLFLGSHVLFREAVGLEWRFSPRWSLGLEFVHASNGDILGPHPYNEGINDVGLRLGHRFE
jgi:hypothetical protein